MGRMTLYSNSRGAQRAGPRVAARSGDANLPSETQAAAAGEDARPRAHDRWMTTVRRKGLLIATGVIVAAVLAGGGVYWAKRPAPRAFTQADIDAAVLHTLETKTLPSAAARAYAAVIPSVVRVRQLGEPMEGERDIERSVGSGVVIVDKGIILTNLHVIAGGDRLGVVFADGTESEATVIGVQPENDLAVIQAKTLPDDLQPATLRGTGDLAPGDEVVAVGFPFGIGPTATAGVISGLRRVHRSSDGSHEMVNLIQFDAAANPGSSGGPLVTMDGEVVGIVTAILNPTEQRVFIGIGFAVPIENAAAAIGLSPF